jgi:hypothetical protein
MRRDVVTTTQLKSRICPVRMAGWERRRRYTECDTLRQYDNRVPGTQNVKRARGLPLDGRCRCRSDKIVLFFTFVKIPN